MTVGDETKDRLETCDPMIVSIHLGLVSDGHCSRTLDMEPVKGFNENRETYIRKISLAFSLAEVARASLASGGSGNGDRGQGKGNDGKRE
jgi:hypothetical protein